MSLQWRAPKWSERTNEVVLESDNAITPHVIVRRSDKGDGNMTARFAEDLALWLNYAGIYGGDFHKAALAYTREQQLNGARVPSAPATDLDRTEITILQAEVARLSEIVGFYERSSTARLLGIAETQLSTARAALGYVRSRWLTTMQSDRPSADTRRAVFGRWFDKIAQWEQEGFPLVEPE